MASKSRIAIIGAGLGGCTAAIMLDKAGFDVRLYEQAPAFSRLGAGIHLGPNVMHVMREIGVEPALLASGLQPERYFSRHYKTGEVMADIPLRAWAAERWGAPYLTIHRGDFHKDLVHAVPDRLLRYGKRLTRVGESDKEVTLHFADGSSDTADIVVGADGVHSVIRAALLGPEAPRHTGFAAHRAVFKTPAQQGAVRFDECAKWWGPERHMVVYYVTASKEEIYFVTGVPGGENWDLSKASIPCSKEEMRAHFDGWHPTIQALIGAADQISLWPLLERDPLPLWSRGRQVLLGDACHPMKPHMGQGAAMAIEDAAVLVRCLLELGPDNHEQAFKLYEANRAGRATRVQQVSRENTWLKTNEDPTWCYGYNAVTVPLVNVPSPPVAVAAK